MLAVQMNAKNMNTFSMMSLFRLTSLACTLFTLCHISLAYLMLEYSNQQQMKG